MGFREFGIDIFLDHAFLDLLAEGSGDIRGYWSSVLNITSISGIIKLAQNHVSKFDVSLENLELFNSNLYNTKSSATTV